MDVPYGVRTTEVVPGPDQFFETFADVPVKRDLSIITPWQDFALKLYDVNTYDTYVHSKTEGFDSEAIAGVKGPFVWEVLNDVNQNIFGIESEISIFAIRALMQLSGIEPGVDALRPVYCAQHEEISARHANKHSKQGEYAVPRAKIGGVYHHHDLTLYGHLGGVLAGGNPLKEQFMDLGVIMRTLFPGRLAHRNDITTAKLRMKLGHILRYTDTGITPEILSLDEELARWIEPLKTEHKRYRSVIDNADLRAEFTRLALEEFDANEQSVLDDCNFTMKVVDKI